MDFWVAVAVTHTKPCGLKAMPQPFLRFGSVCVDGTLPSDTTVRAVNAVATDGVGLPPPPQAARKRAAAGARASR
ncbi:hypothetical protein AVXHC19_14810 [Acidovorax sacchari]